MRTALFRMNRPIKADRLDARIMLNFESVTISRLLKARLVIKIDIVNPIPAKLAPPNNICQFKSSGSNPIPIFIAKY